VPLLTASLRTASVRTALAGACLLALSACTGGSSNDGAPVSFPVGHRAAAPALTGTTIMHNQSFSLASLRGQVVVINYWASWCEPCRDEAPQLKQTYQDFQGKDVTFIGVDFHGDGKDDSAAKAFLTAHQVPYDSIFDRDSKTVLDWKGKVSIEAPPMTIVVDKQGRVANVINGVVQYTDLHEFVADALAEPA
jgi:thiol-disulfide isomerase/thioredoxin